jgi:hypothetical protein
MNAHRLRRPLALAVVAALTLVALAGCAALPTAPTPDPQSDATLVSLVRAPGNAGLIGDLLDGATGLVQSTVETISGTVGGVVTKGRFTVEVPPGAFDGTGDITIEVPDPEVLLVNLHIAKVPNDFNVPVTLEISFAGLEGGFDTNPAYFSIFWFDEEAKRWKMLPSVVDLERQTVSTQLDHFSTYGVLEAKAGW